MRVKATNGDVYFQIDEEDVSLLNGQSWAVINGYVRRNGKKQDGQLNRKAVFLHAAILTPEPGYVIDHINGDRLDNRRSNLRMCKHAQNISNSTKARGTASKYKGVSRGEKGKWVAFCGPRKGNRYLGVYETEEGAARAYDAAAVSLYGAYARINFPSS